MHRGGVAMAYLEVNEERGPLLHANPYGYRVNINHPSINPLYRRYKAWRGITDTCPLSDGERKEFEAYLLPKFQKKERAK